MKLFNLTIQKQYVCLQNYSPPHFVRISRPSNRLENCRWIYWGLETHECSHVVCDLHLCIPIPSIKVMKSLMIFSISHLDRQFQTTYQSRGISIGNTNRTDIFRQLCYYICKIWKIQKPVGLLDFQFSLPQPQNLLALFFGPVQGFSTLLYRSEIRHPFPMQNKSIFSQFVTQNSQ
jgi:hypothetical protein